MARAHYPGAPAVNDYVQENQPDGSPPLSVPEHFRTILVPGGAAYISTPNLLTLAPPGAEKSGNPWHLKEYRAEEFRQLCRSVFGRVELLGVFHARKLRAHELALKLGW